LFCAALCSVGVSTATAQEPAVKVKEEKPGLLAQAKITPDSATRVAQGRVPGGKIRSAEIEMEDGRLIYSFDFKVAGKSGVEEVNVNARTGAIAGVEHETPRSEAAEKAADSTRPRP
jgi:uncharacterized membrane protein YkoI